jgi:hypothetical protein
MPLRVAALAVLVLLLGVPIPAPGRAGIGIVLAQEAARGDKRLLVAENMFLSEAEAKEFWPIYDAYQEELDRIYSRIARVISEYVRAYLDNTLTDQQARALTAEALDIDETEAALAKTYAAKLDGVLPGKKVARYLQLERKIRAHFRNQLAEKIPLVK